MHIDAREGIKPGAKYYEWEMRGVPFRFELGPRDVTAGTVMLARRTGGGKEALPMEGIGPRMVQEVERMQHDLLNTPDRSAASTTASATRRASRRSSTT